MTWLRVDDKTDDLPLIMRLSDAAYRLWSYSLIFCARQKTDGHVPVAALESLAPKRRVKRLVEELLTVVEPYGSLWEVDERRGGYKVVHFLKWNHTREEIEGAQEGAAARTHELPDGDLDLPAALEDEPGAPPSVVRATHPRVVKPAEVR